MSLATNLTEFARGDSSSSGYVNLPIYHASTFTYETVSEYHEAMAETHTYGQEKYARMGTTPVLAFEQAMSRLEGGYAARATSSGLSAITTALLSVVEKDGKVYLPRTCYPSTITFCEKYLKPKLGIDIIYYDASSTSDLVGKLQSDPGVLFLEAPSSYTFEIADLETIIEAARNAGAITIADNTWSGSVFFQPLKLGCDICVVSASKYICGHSDAMLGVIIASEEYFEAVRVTARLVGQNASPDAVFLGLRGLRTLELRLLQHQKSALAVADWFQQQPAVERVHCPALEDNPSHNTWKTLFSGATGLFGIEFTEKLYPGKIYEFIDGCKFFKPGSSWGGFESLIIPAFGKDFPFNHKASGGNLCRVHVGLEDTTDLLDDLMNSFESNLN